MRAWRSSWLVFALFGFALLIVAFSHRYGVKQFARTLVFGQQASGRAHLSLGDSVPPITFVDLLGARATVQAEPHHVLVLNVFATWCPDCIKEAPALSKLREAYAGKPVDIVGIDQDENPAAVLQFARTYGLNFPMFIDHQHQTEAVLGVHYIPATFVVDNRGLVWGDVAGPLTLPQMKQLVQTGLAHLSRSPL